MLPQCPFIAGADADAFGAAEGPAEAEPEAMTIAANLELGTSVRMDAP